MRNLYHDGGFVTSGISEEMIDGLVKLYAEDDE
jgi:enoyl-[acyl-carrier protein] reductase I